MILELKLCFKGAFNKFLCGQGKNPNNLMRKNQNSKTKHVYGLKTAKVMNERFSIYRTDYNSGRGSYSLFT